MSTTDNLRRAPQLELFRSTNTELEGRGRNQTKPKSSPLKLVAKANGRAVQAESAVAPIPDRFPRASRSIWADVPESDWNNWQWQLRHRVTTLAQLEHVIHVSNDEREAIARTQGTFSMAITPYYAALMSTDDPRCPVRQQSVPTTGELLILPSDLEDPLGEEADMPVPGLTHRYPDRVLFYISHNCPVYCRHCTRKRKVAKPTSAAARKQIDDGIDYIARHPEVRDVVVSGGDPLSLSDDRLDEILGRLRAIPHVEIFRIGTRNLVTLPQRITDDFVKMLRKHHPVFINTHFNHPKECTAEAFDAARRLADAGVVLGNQMVLLKGVNDDPATVKELNQKLLMMRIKPYYIYQCDLAKGIGHFRTSVDKGIEIMDALRGWTSGLAVPHFVIDAPNGGGKVPVSPNYVTGREGKKVLLRNYCRKPYVYEEP